MSAEVQVAPKIDAGSDKQSRRRSKDTEKTHRRSTNFQSKKHKHDHKFRKKISANGKFFPPYKKRNKDFIIPPTKFLLGGNITDPLNLNSLQDEDINRAMNAVTPKSSPLPTPKHRKGEIEVIIPPDITDPLNLIAGDDDATYEAMLTSPVKRTQKKQKKNKKRRSHRSSSGPGSGKEDSIEGAKLDESDPAPVKEENTENIEEVKKEVKNEDETSESTKEMPQGPPQKRHKSDNNNRPNLRKMELKERKADMDKIVSPVIPQPGAWNDRHRFRPPPKLTPQINKSQATPKFKENDVKFQFGNYNRYYGYRNPNHISDVRLKVLEKHKHLFKGKDVLDIGCNCGHLTLAIARDFGPNKVVGIDIDRSLIQAARTNIRHYVNCGKKDQFFPVSMPIVYGPVDVPGVKEDKAFPHNISFIQGNYVLESDVLLSMEQPQFDVILCLSITKWIQLNWGDAGLKRAFRRMYAQLRPGGVLILEAQCWGSYRKKKGLTPEIWKNYHSIEFFPHQFSQYLLSEVGFSKCEVIGSPVHPSKGFQRPIKLFIKEDSSFDTPVYSGGPSQPLGSNTERYESYSFRLPDSVHCPDEFSGDSNFPYETPSSFNSPESGFSEGFMHPRRYHHIRLPMDEGSNADGGGTPQAQRDATSTSEESRPTSAVAIEEETDSNSQDIVTEEENRGTKSEQICGDMVKDNEGDLCGVLKSDQTGISTGAKECEAHSGQTGQVDTVKENEAHLNEQGCEGNAGKENEAHLHEQKGENNVAKENEDNLNEQAGESDFAKENKARLNEQAVEDDSVKESVLHKNVKSEQLDEGTVIREREMCEHIEEKHIRECDCIKESVVCESHIESEVKEPEKLKEGEQNNSQNCSEVDSEPIQGETVIKLDKKIEDSDNQQMGTVVVSISENSEVSDSNYKKELDNIRRENKKNSCKNKEINEDLKSSETEDTKEEL